MTAEKPEKAPEIAVHRCGPKLTCPDGSEHDYSKWENRADGSGTAVCSKCGHAAIDDAYWM